MNPATQGLRGREGDRCERRAATLFFAPPSKQKTAHDAPMDSTKVVTRVTNFSLFHQTWCKP